MSPVVPNPVAEWGALLVETDIDRSVLLRLRRWMPTYLTALERQRNLPPKLLARPKPGSYQNVLEDDDFPDGQLPAVVVTTSKIEGDVGKSRADDGTDRWEAGFRVVVSVVVRGRDAAETREVAALFAGCVRRILLHKQLDGSYDANGLDVSAEVWLAGGTIAPLADSTDKGRWLAAGRSEFMVFVDEVVSGVGPVLPSDDNPYPDPDPEDPDSPYDPLAIVREGGVTTTITTRS